MTLTDHLKNIAEHNKTSVYKGEDVPLYMVNRFFSFVSDAHCQILNTMVNFDHWNEVDNELKMKLMRSVIPKTKYNYYKLFGKYIKNPSIEKKTKNLKAIKTLCELYEISKKEAEEYLEQDGVEELVINYEK